MANYRVLDDEAGEFPQPTPAELIVCAPTVGVTGADVITALQAWLMSEPSRT